MGKLRILSGEDVCKILEQNGFVQVRQRGSHIMMQLQAEDFTITVPVPNHDELKDGTLLANQDCPVLCLRYSKLNWRFRR